MRTYSGDAEIGRGLVWLAGTLVDAVTALIPRARPAKPAPTPVRRTAMGCLR